MLYTDNLEKLIFHRHELLRADELIIVSGYVGPGPIHHLHQLPLHSRIVYGMYGVEGVRRPLHNSLTRLQNTIKNIDIFYSNLPVHSKCYVWLNKGQIVYALVGSANFSSKGLTTPFREILAETTHDAFPPLNDYITRILNNSISCLEADAAQVVQHLPTAEAVCSLSLLGRGGEVQNAAGLNWGQNPENHTNRDDAYIKIRIQDILQFPDLFPPKQLSPTQQDGRGRPQRHNDKIDIIWDDGATMEGIFFGNQYIDGVRYPKQVGSFPKYNEMGKYFRKRLRVPLGQPVRRYHLNKYGRTDVEVSLLSEGVYKFDFSV